MSLTRHQRSTEAPRLGRLSKLCASLPEAVIEPYGLGHHMLRVRRKTFAYHLHDHHGDGRIALCCKGELVEQQRLVRSDPETFFVPAYLGVHGWIGMRLDLAKVDWRQARMLLRWAYQDVAPSRLAAMLDEPPREGG